MPNVRGLNLSCLLIIYSKVSLSVFYVLQLHIFVFAIQKASQDMSSLKTLAGQTGRKLTTLATNLISDLQDRIR